MKLISAYLLFLQLLRVTNAQRAPEVIPNRPPKKDQRPDALEKDQRPDDQDATKKIVDGVPVDPKDRYPVQAARNAACLKLEIKIHFDRYPRETSWEVAYPDGTIVESGDDYPDGYSGAEVTENYCLPPLCGYVFTIGDTWGDGICCRYGAGSYTVTYDDVVVASGATFTSSESTAFGLPLKIEIDFDHYPGDISWEVADADGAIVESGDDYPDGYSGAEVTENYCLLPLCNYTFTIDDSYGDGLCCEFDAGSYTVTYDDVVVASGANFTISESTPFGCATTAPNTAPSSPPTVSTAPSSPPTVSTAPTTAPNSPPIARGK